MNTALFPDLVVNGETVPHTVVAAEAQNHTGPSDKPGIAWRKAANAVAIRTLLLQEAQQRGLEADPAEVGPGRFETEEEALIRGLLDTEMDGAAPDEEAIRTEWDRDPERFRAPPLWEVSHILCSCDPRDEAATAKAKACIEGLAAKVQANPRAFAHIATDNSDCGSKSSGGALGQLGPGDTVPEFEDALRGLKAGEITAEPVLTRHGWHLIRMDAVAEGAVLPYETARPRISDAIQKTNWARQAQAFVNKLVASAEITGADLRRE
ncbi:peptidylprolyl isomerase [Aliiroseovarius subalbicans]|uniref:peptidylprolyl isomerase n=1 Tax=Aliiroseovarius subalbicans TaxID=2925840 RepID=UPI001F59C487|nr:peptidylprolyl isomerase [Aliiroseovarius subalbicans]MCI2399616.1 peptidylprolyl isomerase [Aliiroseovarius subalbicans]